MAFKPPTLDAIAIINSSGNISHYSKALFYVRQGNEQLRGHAHYLATNTTSAV